MAIDDCMTERYESSNSPANTVILLSQFPFRDLFASKNVIWLFYEVVSYHLEHAAIIARKSHKIFSTATTARETKTCKIKRQFYMLSSPLRPPLMNFMLSRKKMPLCFPWLVLAFRTARVLLPLRSFRLRRCKIYTSKTAIMVCFWTQRVLSSISPCGSGKSNYICSK